MSTYYQGVVILILTFTCVGLFVVTAIAVALDLFNRLRLRPDVRKRLHVVLLSEVVMVSVATFAALLHPTPIAQKVESAKTHLEARLGDDDVEVGFPGLDTTSAPGYAVPAAPLLHQFGVSVENMTPPGSEVVLVNNRALYEGKAVAPTISQNLLTQMKTGNQPASFMLKFVEPFVSVRFLRPALYPASPSGITHPAWIAHALDANGDELSSVGEGLLRSFEDVPARAYTLVSTRPAGIVAIRFDSDPRLHAKPFAAFDGVLIEDLTMSRGKR